MQSAKTVKTTLMLSPQLGITSSFGMMKPKATASTTPSVQMPETVWLAGSVGVVFD